MNHIMKAWHWKPDEATAKSGSLRALRLLCWFLVLAAGCTLIARAADSVTVPVVTVESPRRSALTHKLTFEGRLEQGEGTPVIAPQNVTVKEVAVKKGDFVEAGDLLFTWDMAEAQREISQKQLDIQGIQAELAALKEGQQLEKTESKTAKGRAEEDLETIKAQHDLKIQEAGLRLREARLAMRKYDGDIPDTTNEDDFTETEYDALRTAYRTASLAYDQVVADKEQAILKAQRIIDDATPTGSPDATMELKNISLRKAQLELSVLYEAVADGGKVIAPVSGAISELSAAVGKSISSGDAAVITEPGGMLFTAELDREQRKLVDVGDPVKLTLCGETQPWLEVTVKEILPIADRPDTYRLTASLPTDEIPAGRSVSGTVSRITPFYETCIPLSSLLGSKDNYYVLVLREIESALGTEYIAERVDVTLQEHNESTAAVSGALSQDSKIIAGGDRLIREGDRVRLAG